MAMEMYRGDNDEVYPYAAVLPSLGLNNIPRLCDVLMTYVDNNTKVFQCPADSENYFVTESGPIVQRRWKETRDRRPGLLTRA